MKTAKLIYGGEEYDLPVFAGSEGEAAIDVSKLREQTGAVVYDPGYGNVGSCRSTITFIDGDKGILRYRGYPIEQLAQKACFSEVCHLLIHDHLPDEDEFVLWRRELTLNSFIHEDMLKFFEGFPSKSHPMAILAAMIASLSAYHPEEERGQTIEKNIIRLLAKVKTFAAFSYKKSVGEPFVYPLTRYSYAQNFLRMMFATPAEDYEPPKVLADALNMLLIIHADHEQNCSTSTVRMVGSSRANLFASVSAGVSALWGPLHGGANQAVIEMLEHIIDDGGDCKAFVAKVKEKKSRARLMGFGHRVYKNYDPRARLLKKANDDVHRKLGIKDPLLDVALELEEIALSDEYFIERNLYPNVDFYSGILYRAMGIPTDMFTVMFAMGRTPGWIAHWKEQRDTPNSRIHRPRQIYTGATERKFISMDKRPKTKKG
jgi:citrate synthase